MHCFIKLRNKLFLDCQITCIFDTGIFRYMLEEGVRNMNFLDKKGVRFQDFRKTLDARKKELASRGICQANRSVDSRTRVSDDKIYFEFLGAHEKNLLGDFTEEHSRKIDLPLFQIGDGVRNWLFLHMTTDEYVPE